MGKKMFQRFFERLHRISLRGMNYGNGAFVEYSGEIHVIKNLHDILGGKSFTTIFDAGSNDGGYLSYFLNNFQGDSFVIHCFEPSTFAFEKLDEKYGSAESVVLNNIGLGEEENTMELFYNEKGSTMASLYRFDYLNSNVKSNDSEKVEISTVDRYCAANNIDEIDFMKIDVEGHEISILKGASSMIARGKINVIQFEIGANSLISSTHLHRFFRILPGYSIFRILQDGLQKIDYDERLEIFMTTNYLAIKNDIK